MKKAEHLIGVWTALITPFQKDESIDWESFDKLLTLQLQAGVTGIVISGTTGESPTLMDEERVELIKYAKTKVQGKCLVMAGTGTNCTRESIEKTEKAYEAGADMILLVNPYYSKPTQEGLYLHFKKIAESVDLPVILYNIKGRTGINLETSTLKRLVNDTENIIGVKEASGDLSQIKEVCDLKLDNFMVLSGDDNITFKTMRECGVNGVISVASNIVPKEIVKMVNFLLTGSFYKAKELNTRLENLFQILFLETNPIPVKYVAHLMGLCQNVYRLPMCEISKVNGEMVRDSLKKRSLIT